MWERFLPCLNHELVINKCRAFHLCSLMCCTLAQKLRLLLYQLLNIRVVFTAKLSIKNITTKSLSKKTI